MEAKTKNDMATLFGEWYQIIVNLHICQHNLKKLLEGENGVRYTMVHGSGFFDQHYRLLVFYAFILELSKLFGSSKFDQVSMKLTLERILKGDFDSQVDPEKLAEIDSLKSGAMEFLERIEEQADTLEKIKNFRDKNVAHRDIDFIENPVGFGALSELIKFSAEIYNGIGYFFQKGTLFQFVHDWEIDRILFFCEGYIKLSKEKEDAILNSIK